MVSAVATFLAVPRTQTLFAEVGKRRMPADVSLVGGLLVPQALLDGP
jgi:hypothetical protein